MLVELPGGMLGEQDICLTVSPSEFARWIWRDAEPVVTRNVGVANAFISSAEVLGERPSEWMAGWLAGNIVTRRVGRSAWWFSE